MLRCAVFLSIAVLVPTARAGESPDSSRAPAMVRAAAAGGIASSTAGGFSAGAGLEHHYDSNILQLTQRNLDRLDANPTPPRFLVETPDDNVTELSADLAWRVRPVRRRETKLAASADVSRFQRNAVKNWEEYGLSLTQELTASRRSLSTLRVWWSAVPEFYLGQITDADESFAAGTRIRRPLSYAQSELGTRVRQRLARGRVEFSAGFERLRRDYERHFDERDNHNDQWELSADVQPLRRSDVVLGVTWRTGSLSAAGDLPSTPIRDTDISYDHRGLGASVEVPWGRGDRRGRARIEWMPESRRYTTPDKFDVLRYGRVNHRQETNASVTQRIGGPLEVVATYDRLTSDASFPDGIVISPDLSDFTQVRYGIQLRSRWNIRGPRQANGGSGAPTR